MSGRTAAFSLFSATAVVLLLVAVTANGHTMVGGKQAGDVSSPEVLEAAKQGLQLLNHGDATKLQGLHMSGLLQLSQIKAVSSQVVAGVSYTLTLAVKDANGADADLEMVVWSRPWLVAKNDASNPAFQVTSVKRITNTA